MQQSSRIEVGTVQDFNETDGSNNTQSVDDLTLPTRVSVILQSSLYCKASVTVGFHFLTSGPLV